MKNKRVNGAAKLGEIIREIRERNNLALRDFAEKCPLEGSDKSLGWNTVMRLEQGKILNPKTETLRAIASNPYVDYSVEELLAIVDNRQSTSLREMLTAEEGFSLVSELSDSEKKNLISLLAADLPKEYKVELTKVLIELVAAAPDLGTSQGRQE